MDPELIQKVLDSAPWAAPFVLVAFLLRKEIAALLTAGRDDSNMESLMTKMVEQFAQNLVFFKAVAHDTEIMQAALSDIRRTSGELVEIQRSLKEEVLRQGARR